VLREHIKDLCEPGLNVLVLANRVDNELFVRTHIVTFDHWSSFLSSRMNSSSPYVSSSDSLSHTALDMLRMCRVEAMIAFAISEPVFSELRRSIRSGFLAPRRPAGGVFNSVLAVERVHEVGDAVPLHIAEWWDCESLRLKMGMAAIRNVPR
jgi:hypothetical protein